MPSTMLIYMFNDMLVEQAAHLRKLTPVAGLRVPQLGAHLCPDTYTDLRTGPAHRCGRCMRCWRRASAPARWRRCRGPCLRAARCRTRSATWPAVRSTGPACRRKTLQPHAHELEADDALPSSYALLLDGSNSVVQDCTWPCAASSSHFNHVPLCLHAACPTCRPATDLPRHAMVKQSHRTVHCRVQACTWARC